jgi:hypothetical protein
MARRVGRTQRCSADDARIRRAHAAKFLEVAEIAAGELDEDPEYASAAASLAVLAGIAAADSACCKALGERSRSQDHHDAERVLRGIVGGDKAAGHLRDLLSLKDEAQYGLSDLGPADLRKALRQARSLGEFADDVLHR